MTKEIKKPASKLAAILTSLMMVVMVAAMVMAFTPTSAFADAAADDQVRITTPERAREIGSDFIVVGRPVTAAADPVAAYERCMREFAEE